MKQPTKDELKKAIKKCKVFEELPGDFYGRFLYLELDFGGHQFTTGFDRVTPETKDSSIRRQKKEMLKILIDFYKPNN